MTVSIQPFGDRVLVKILEPEQQTAGGLVVPVAKELSNKGEVVALGPEVKDVQVGDIVAFQLGGATYSTKENDYKLFNERDILCKFIKENK